MKVFRWSARKEYKYEHLAYIFKNKVMEPFLVTVTKKDIDARMHQNSHDGQEFDYVIEGSMTLYINKNEIALNVGDAVYYDAKIPIRWRRSRTNVNFYAS